MERMFWSIKRILDVIKRPGATLFLVLFSLFLVSFPLSSAGENDTLVEEVFGSSSGYQRNTGQGTIRIEKRPDANIIEIIPPEENATDEVEFGPIIIQPEIQWDQE